MAYDERLAARVRSALRGREDVSERKMFGGLCFLVRGRMACGVTGDELMVHVGADLHEEALAEPHARPMDFTGRPLRGMVYVGRGGIAAEADLEQWVGRGVRSAESRPAR